MPKNLLRHLFLSGQAKEASYTYVKDVHVNRPEPPVRDPEAHRQRLSRELAAIWAKAEQERGARSAVQKRTKDGVYIQFEGASDSDLPWTSLEDQRQGIRLLNVQESPAAGISPGSILATVYFPAGKELAFLKKLDEYQEKGQGRLVACLEHLRIAVLESFWCDDPNLMPSGETPQWCEIWLRHDADTNEEADLVLKSFKERAEELELLMRPGILRFPERSVVLCHASRNQLRELVESFEFIAEFRRAKETPSFFMQISNEDRTAFARNLLSRIEPITNAPVAVLVLDTGVNNGHMLLRPALQDSDCHAVKQPWGGHDHHGHGTLMCGLAAFGDLAEALDSTGPFPLQFCL